MTRDGRLLLVGDGLSAFGAWIDFLAILTLAAYQFHVTPYEMAAVSAAGLLPGMLAAQRIGRWCDRGNPKRLLLASVVGRVAATAAILVCHAYVLFVALVALRSLFATVAPPAINVMAVRSLAAEQRPRFYAVLNVLNNAAKVLAPALGTVTSSLSGEAAALWMSLACSAAAFAAFAGVGMTAPLAAPQPAAAPAAAGVPTAPAASLLPLLWCAATCAFFIFMVNNLVPLVLQQTGLDKALLGLLVGCSGAGNILSGLWLARSSAGRAMRGQLQEMVLPALAQAIGFGLIGWLLLAAPGRAALLLPMIFFAIGIFSARYAIALNVHLSTHFAAAIGSVSGTLQAWQSAMIFVAPLLGAVILDRLGAAALFGFATVAGLVSLTALLAWQAALQQRKRLAG